MAVSRKKNEKSPTAAGPLRKKAKKRSSTELDRPESQRETSELTKKKKKTSHSGGELAKTRKKKKVIHKDSETSIKKTKKGPISRIELQELPTEMLGVRRGKEVSHTDKESAEKLKKKILLKKIKLQNISFDISDQRRQKKRLSNKDKEHSIKKTKKSSLVETELLECPLNVGRVRKEGEVADTNKELIKRKKKKSSSTKNGTPKPSSHDSEPRTKKKKLFDIDKEPAVKKTKKSSLAQAEPQKAPEEMSEEEDIAHKNKEQAKKEKKKSPLTKNELPKTALDINDPRRKPKMLSNMDKTPVIKKTKKSSLAQVEWQESPIEMSGVRKEKAVSHMDEDAATKEKKKSILTDIEWLETSSDISEWRKKKKKSHKDKEPAIKMTKKSSLAQTDMQEFSVEMSGVRREEEVSHTDKEPTKEKKKKSPLTRIEWPETSSGISEPSRKEKKLSHTDKEPTKEKKMKSPLTQNELPETSSDISEPRKKKKKLSHTYEEPAIKKTKRSSFEQTELQESPLKTSEMRKDEVSEHAKKKSSLTEIELPETSPEINGLRMKEKSNTEKERELPKETEWKNSSPEMKLTEPLTETGGLVEVFHSEKESESYPTIIEPIELPQQADVSSQAKADSPQKIIVIPDSWCQAATSIAYDSVAPLAPITVVCGAKNSGKTTFCRFLLNNIIQRYGKVAYLETDVGQAEFTPPGCLSLIVLDKQIPAFADLTDQCLEIPERCFFFGDISSKRNPTAYLNNVVSLYDYFRTKYCMFNENEDPSKPQLPLVVNTPGWVKGIGYDILVEMLKYIAPTHVVQIRISIENKNLPIGPFWLNEYHEGPINLIEIGAVHLDHSGKWLLRRKNSKLMRDRRIFLYFRQCFPCDLNVTSWKDLAHALASHPPYEVSLSSIKVRHLHCQIPSSEVLHSLNATIVGLAVSSTEPRDSGCCPPWCVGLGIVRGIDISKNLLYVLTPVPQNTLKNVDLLLQGFVQIPTYLLQVQGCRSPYMSEHSLPTS